MLQEHRSLIVLRHGVDMDMNTEVSEMVRECKMYMVRDMRVISLSVDAGEGVTVPFVRVL